MLGLLTTAPLANAAPARRTPRPAVKKAAPTPVIRSVVDAKGRLRLSAAQMRSLKPKVASNGLVCLEFPVSVLQKPPQPPKSKSPGRDSHAGHSHEVEDIPPRVWITAAADGSLTLVQTRLIPGNERVPGAPGTAWLIRSQNGCLLVRKPG